jgi:hypothetical protein
MTRVGAMTGLHLLSLCGEGLALRLCRSMCMHLVGVQYFRGRRCRDELYQYQN